MKLQIALDGTLDDSLAILHAVHEYVGIAEIGTPLIYREGMAAVRALRDAFPDLTLLADLKIMDAGDEEASIAFEAGANIVTVLALTQDATVRGAVAAAQRHGGQVMADLMQVPDLVSCARALLEMGVAYLCLHTAHDLKGSGVSPLDGLRQMCRSLPGAPLAIAGGIGLGTIEAVVPLCPEIVIVGGAITRADDPARVARLLRERMPA